MSKYDTYKTLIFNSPLLKKKLIWQINAAGYKAANFETAYEKLFFEVDENNLQRIMAPFLRELAISRLKTHDSELCKHFRNTYETDIERKKRLQFLKQETIESRDLRLKNETELESRKRRTIETNSTQEEYLSHQARNGVMGTDLDGAALAQALNLNFYVTLSEVNGKPLVIQDKQGNPVESVDTLVCHKAEPMTEDSVHLYNVDQFHFFVFEYFHSTIGDGNCLYNGFAQHIQQFMAFERLQAKQQEDARPIGHADIINHLILYKHQLETYHKLKNLPPLTDSELTKLAAEHMKSSVLTLSEQKLCKVVATEPELPFKKNAKEIANELTIEGDIFGEKENSLFSMMLKYQEACQAILLGIAVATVTVVLLAMFSIPVAVSLSTAAVTGAAAFGFFSMQTKKEMTEEVGLFTSHTV